MRRKAVIVRLVEWRHARQAAEVLAKLLDEPHWLRGIRLTYDASGQVRITVSTWFESDMARLMTPMSVNNVPTDLVAKDGAMVRRGSEATRQSCTSKPSPRA